MSLSVTALVDLTQAKNYLRVDAAASLHVDAEYVGVGTGTEDEFPLVDNKVPVSGSLKLYVENAEQAEDTNFSIDGYTITFKAGFIPGNGDIITASYDYEAGANTFESYDDELLENLIEAATRKAEEYTGRAFIRRDIVETRIGDGTQILKLYKQPVVDVASVVIDTVDLTSWSERLSIGRLYHPVLWTEYSEIVITYTAGYAVSRADTQVLVPDAMAAVLLMVAYLYENRVDMVHGESVSGVGSVTYELPLYADKSGAILLLNPYRTQML